VACVNLVKLDPQVRRGYALKQKYGLSLAEYDTMMNEQNGGCAICGANTNRLHVDHNHKTGKLRGLLCSNCNTSLGKFKDDVQILKKAITYIKD
jgi:hypothetical protein